jgi:hypothetical protein
MTIDSIREFRELTEIKLQSKQSGCLWLVEAFQRILFKILLSVQELLR